MTARMYSGTNKNDKHSILHFQSVMSKCLRYKVKDTKLLFWGFEDLSYQNCAIAARRQIFLQRVGDDHISQERPIHDFSPADLEQMRPRRDCYLHQAIQHIVDDVLRHDAVMLVARMAHNELPHPRRARENLSRSAFVNEVEVLAHGLSRGGRAIDHLQVAPNQRDESWEVFLGVSPRLHAHVPIQNLEDGVLAVMHRTIAADARKGRLATRVRHATVGEPELLLEDRVPLLRTLHVLVHFGHGDVKLEVVEENGAAEKPGKHGERGILELGEHDFHGSELDSPRLDRASDGGRFPANALPVRGLDVLELKEERRRRTSKCSDVSVSLYDA